MKRFLWLLIFASSLSYGQDLSKADRKIVSNLKKHIGYLADDKLEGRRTGSHGERLAYEYIFKQFSKADLQPKAGNGNWVQEFEVNDGMAIDPQSYININGKMMEMDKEWFPLFTCNRAEWQSSAMIPVDGSQYVKLLDIKDLIEQNKDNPHFDLVGSVKTTSEEFAKQTKLAGALLICNSSDKADELKFDKKTKTDIPVIYITKAGKENHFKNISERVTMGLMIQFQEKKRMGHNVIGYIDNGAVNTIILGAHYDHLGYGEDHNSLYAGSTPMIHNGADDNASGTAALIELGKMLKRSEYKKNNYLFIAFSGEELGLFGSKYFTEHPSVDLKNVDYMINMDMVGRLNDSTHGLSIGGYGTSPTWGTLMSEKTDVFKIKFDSSGTGPSDHTSFYRKDIPVLFFFTGTHSDYHKPSDDADKINYVGELQVIKYIYHLVGMADEKDKLAFTKTRESQSTGRSSFKVTLGIMPDYTYSGTGVRVDGVSEGKLAQRTGIKTGDVLVQLGDHKFSDVQTYMETLGKFNKGDATKVKLKRGAEELTFDIVF